MDDYDYSTSSVLLPLDCTVPDFSDSILGGSFKDILAQIRAQFVETVGKLNEEKLLSIADTNSTLRSLYCSLSNVLLYLDDSISNEAPIISLDLNKRYDLYDEYFKIQRYTGNNPLVYLKNLLSIFAQQILIISDSQVSYYEILSGVTGMHQALSAIDDDLGRSKDSNLAEVRLKPIVEKAYPATINASADPALWRWRTGHAFFAVMLHFSERYLRSALEIAIAEQIDNAGLFFRASTSAMWFASTFVQSVYLRHVRPSMVSTNAPHGFSGTDNRDFAKWKETKDRFIEVFKERKTVDKQTHEALLRFESIYYTDMEHHIILANEMVFTSASLKSEKIAANYHRPTFHSAVNTLREMLDLRKDELDFIKKIKANDQDLSM